MKKRTKIIKWIDIKNPERELFGVRAHIAGQWIDVTHRQEPCFFRNKKEAKEFEKKVEKILNDSIGDRPLG